jgi:hypothetical protein
MAASPGEHPGPLVPSGARIPLLAPRGPDVLTIRLISADTFLAACPGPVGLFQRFLSLVCPPGAAGRRASRLASSGRVRPNLDDQPGGRGRPLGGGRIG